MGVPQGLFTFMTSQASPTLKAYLESSHGAVETDRNLYEPLCTSYLPYLMCLSHCLVTAGIWEESVLIDCEIFCSWVQTIAPGLWL